MHLTKYPHVCLTFAFTEIKLIEKMKNRNNFPYGDDLWPSFIDRSRRRIYDDYATSLHSILPHDDLANRFSLMPIFVDYFPNHPLEDLIDLHRNDDEPGPFCPENLTLELADFELNMQLCLLQQEVDSNSCLQNYIDAAPSRSICDSYRRMKIGDEAAPAKKQVCVKKTEDRVNLPKSISVRCKGFIKAAKKGGDWPMGRIRIRGRVRALDQV